MDNVLAQHDSNLMRHRSVVECGESVRVRAGRISLNVPKLNQQLVLDTAVCICCVRNPVLPCVTCSNRSVLLLSLQQAA